MAIDDYPDLVVTFDDATYKMVFWHGTAYNMNLVTENGRWIGDQSAEAPRDEFGCVETCRTNKLAIRMSACSKIVQPGLSCTGVTRFTGCHVQHWRADLITGWGDWADEYYTIYPDGLAVRHFLVHAPRDRYSITERQLSTIRANEPGQCFYRSSNVSQHGWRDTDL